MFIHLHYRQENSVIEGKGKREKGAFVGWHLTVTRGQGIVQRLLLYMHDTKLLTAGEFHQVAEAGGLY
jgi:hypothetical protein